jgi:NitT/TauT family transport system permease protein
MTLVKSTPVASIIMVLWVIIGSANLPSVLGFLMVAPIIWQNLTDGFSSIDKDLSEFCDVFEFSRKKRFKILIYPTLLKYFIPAALTSIGLAWKSGIAAEILTYTKNSIGKNISDAKAYFEGTDLLAWTVTVITISLAFEFLISRVARRVRNATHT